MPGDFPPISTGGPVYRSRIEIRTGDGHKIYLDEWTPTGDPWPGLVAAEHDPSSFVLHLDDGRDIGSDLMRLAGMRAIANAVEDKDMSVALNEAVNAGFAKLGGDDQKIDALLILDPDAAKD